MAVFTTGCTEPQPAPTVTTSPPANQVNPNGDNVTPSAIDPLAYWEQNPSDVPPEVEASTTLVHESGVGSQTFSLPRELPSPVLQLIVTCQEPVEYELHLEATGSTAELPWTKGDSCGGPNINIFTTPKLDEGRAPTSVVVRVPEQAKYYLVVLSADVDRQP
ncbi:hypothetical protein [Georgenia yuyongxinii]